MTTLKTLTAILILTLCSATTATPCFAKCPYEDKAKNLYRVGADSYAAKDFGRALYVFTKVQKLCPTVSMIYNLARVNDLAGNSDKAVGLYQEYLKLKDPSASPIDIEKRVKVLRSQAATYWSDPFEGEKKATKPCPKPPKTKPCPQVPAQATMMPETPRYKRPWAWVATGTGLALIGTGTALLATRTVNEWSRDDAGKLVTTTDSVAPGAALVAAGAVATGVGVWLFARGEAVTVAPSVAPGGASLVVAGTF